MSHFKNPTIVGYCRGTSQDILKQKHILMNHCKLNSWTLLNTYSDENWDSTSYHRPGLIAMLNCIRMEDVSSVLVCEGYILTTSPQHAYDLVDTFKKTKTNLWFVDMGTHFNDVYPIILSSMEFLKSRRHWFDE